MKKWQGLAVGGLFLGSVVCGASRVQAACIDPSTLAVDTLGDCLFIDKSATDCRLGFAVDMDGAGAPPADPNKIECVDGTACDADGAVNGSCVFRVGACVNLPVAACSLGTAATAVVTGPSAKDAGNAFKTPAAVYNRRALTDAFDSLLPSAVTACTSPNLPVKVDLKKKTGKCGSPVGQSCSSDQECDDYCIPSFSKSKVKVGVSVLDGAGKPYDKGLMKLSCVPAPAGAAGARAFQIASSGDLIGGPLAMGRVGDYMIRNGNVRAVIRGVGREHSFGLLNGGQLIDADLARANPADDRDSWQGIQPMVNISSTQGTDSVVVESSGSDGKPAIIRSSGPDDLLDVIMPDVMIFTSTPLSVPQSAVDVNLPLQITTDYILSPFSNAIQIATKVENLGGTALKIYMGDFVNPSGQLEAFGPGQGFGETLLRNGGDLISKGQTLDFLAFQGVAGADGVSYGLVFPKTVGWTTRSSSAFAQSGVFAWVNNQDLFHTLFNDPNAKPAGSFTIPAGGENTLRRWFVIGKTVADVSEVRTDLFLQDKAALQGTITVNGAPVKGAHVALLNNNGNFKSSCPSGRNCTNVFSGTLTDEAGFYRFMVPAGEYRVAARATGTPYENSLDVPTETSVLLTKKKTLVQNIDLPGTATVTVNVVDQSGSPVAAKVSVVGVPASPDPLNTEVTAGLLAVAGRYFGFPIEEKGDVFGLPAVEFADASGSTGAFKLEPGSYHVVVSHGPEFDAYDEVINLTAGGSATVNATVNRVVDTSGFVSMDNHVHMLYSPDSEVSPERRITTMLAEGVDYFSSTDHDFVHSLSDQISSMGVGGLIASAPSDEITTSHYGHFNVWPLTVNAAKVDGGAFDWGRAGETNGAGYPSDGSYDVAPRDIFGAFNPTTQVIQINHFNSGSGLGNYSMLGIDTGHVPPVSSNRVYRCVGGSFNGNPCQIAICLGGDDDGSSCTSNADCSSGGGSCSSANPFGRSCPGGTCTLSGPLSQYLRLDPAETNLFDNGFTALEVWIEAGRSQTSLLRSQNFGDWFNLLNQGIFKTGVADSDTHQNVIVQAGGPRTYVASSTDDPASIDPSVLALSTNAMRAIGSNGLFMKVSLDNNAGGTASQELAHSRSVEFTGGGVDKVKVHIEAPTWAQYDRIEVYMNSDPACKSEWTFFGVVNPSSCDVTPTLTLNKGTDFSVAVETGISGHGQRQVTDVTIPVTIADDTWVVVVARGTDGVSKPLFPMNPQNLNVAANATLSDLTDGGTAPPWNLGEEGALALAYSNPLFFDDGDGMWQDTATSVPGF